MKTEAIRVRISMKEKLEFEAAAIAEGLGLSAWLRMVAKREVNALNLRIAKEQLHPDYLEAAKLWNKA